MSALSLLFATALTLSGPMDPPPITMWDGKEWGRIVIGETTDRNVKEMYDTEKGALRPEALKIQVRKDAGAAVNVLLDGRGEKARATAIAIDFKTGYEPTDLSGFDLERAYVRNRSLDWHIAFDVDKGLGLFVVEGKVRSALLATPNRIRALVDRTSEEASELVAFRDEFKDIRSLGNIGYVDASASASGIDIRDDRDVERDLKNRFERFLRFSDWLNLRFGSRGRVSVTARADYSTSKGGNMSVNVSATVESAYGLIEGSGSGSDSLAKGSRNPRWYDARPFQDAMDEAYQVLIADLRGELRKRIPATPEAGARRDWRDRVLEST